MFGDFHHNNIGPHTYLKTQKILGEFGWEVLMYPRQSRNPELTVCIINVKLTLKATSEQVYENKYYSDHDLEKSKKGINQNYTDWI